MQILCGLQVVFFLFNCQTPEQAEENGIILMHDGYESTVQALERFIPLLEAEGYEFVTVDQVIMD